MRGGTSSRSHEAADVVVVDVAPGLWIWRIEHPGWKPDADWQPVVTCVCVDAGEERWLVDPLLPPDDATQVWDRLDERPPTVVAVIIPDHLREIANDRAVWSLDVIVDRYHAKAFGPRVWDPNQGPPNNDVTILTPDTELPGGVRALRSPRGNDETPLWLPEHRTLVFGDTLTERDGALRVWMSPTHEERAIPELRAMFDLGAERAIISHGEPLHTRDDLEAALDRPPWPASSLHIAAYRGFLDIVKRRVAAGADLDERDELYRKTPLEWAEMGKQPEVLQYLRIAAARQ